MGLEKKFRRAIENKLPDLKEKFGAQRHHEAPSSRRTMSMGEVAHSFEAFIPKETCDALFELTTSLSEGMYLNRVQVGEKGSSKAHPHDFVIERTQENVSFYFLDPEHHVGVRDPLRPPVDNIMALTIDSKKEVSFAILRILTSNLAAQNMASLKMTQQLEAARSLIAREGLASFVDTPDTSLRPDIRFRLTLSHTPEGAQAVIQSHDVSSADQAHFLHTGEMSSYLKGKASSQRAILNHFKEYLEAGAFQAVDPKTLKPLRT